MPRSRLGLPNEERIPSSALEALQKRSRARTLSSRERERPFQENLSMRMNFWTRTSPKYTNLVRTRHTAHWDLIRNPRSQRAGRLTVGVENGYDEVNVQIPEEENETRVIGQELEKGSLRSDRTRALVGRYVATELLLELGHYIATKYRLELGRYVATELEPELDDLPGHTGLLSHHVQESKSQPCLVAQYRSMFRLKYRSMSDGRYRSTGDECLRSTMVSEYRSMGLVPVSTVVDENRAMNKRCCRSMRIVLLCGLNAPNLQDLVRIAVEFPCCFWYGWSCT
ncbi:hypothetical protein F2Q69_00013432 [Brassica cretica]|uniref:Uncharacterized protein n=1 Tax=Brassica cretica TaxID=69181 RepID=A0A8S9QSS4_BRACR|nr:hypothetical protein F2Q69_00013432 [Brassica cretica]